MLRQLPILLLAMACPGAVFGSQAFESLAYEVKISGVLGFDTYTIAASNSKESHPVKLENFEVRINDELLPFPAAELGAMRNVYIQLVSISYASGIYEVVLPYAGEGYCDDPSTNTMAPTRGHYRYSFNRSFDFVSSSLDAAEDSCQEGETHVFVD